MSQTYIDQCLVYLADGDYQDAENLAGKVTKSDPGNAEGWRTLAAALLGQGQVQAASNYINKAITLAPQDPQVHRVLGQIYLEQENFDAAADALREAYRLSDNDTDIAAQYAKCLAHEERFDQAKALLKPLRKQTAGDVYLDSAYVYTCAVEAVNEIVFVGTEEIPLVKSPEEVLKIESALAEARKVPQIESSVQPLVDTLQELHSDATEKRLCAALPAKFSLFALRVFFRNFDAHLSLKHHAVKACLGSTWRNYLNLIYFVCVLFSFPALSLWAASANGEANLGAKALFVAVFVAVGAFLHQVWHVPGWKANKKAAIFLGVD